MSGDLTDQVVDVRRALLTAFYAKLELMLERGLESGRDVVVSDWRLNPETVSYGIDMALIEPTAELPPGTKWIYPTSRGLPK